MKPCDRRKYSQSDTLIRNKIRNYLIDDYLKSSEAEEEEEDEQKWNWGITPRGRVLATGALKRQVSLALSAILLIHAHSGKVSVALSLALGVGPDIVFRYCFKILCPIFRK